VKVMRPMVAAAIVAKVRSTDVPGVEGISIFSLRLTNESVVPG
jgi:hypothetical protein